MSMPTESDSRSCQGVLRHNTETFAADAGFAGVGSRRLESKDDPIEVVMARRSRAGLRSGVEAAGIEPASANRSERASTSVGRLRFRPPAGDSRPTDGLAILWCRASGDWLSLGA